MPYHLATPACAPLSAFNSTLSLPEGQAEQSHQIHIHESKMPDIYQTQDTYQIKTKSELKMKV